MLQIRYFPGVTTKIENKCIAKHMASETRKQITGFNDAMPGFKTFFVQVLESLKLAQHSPMSPDSDALIDVLALNEIKTENDKDIKESIA